MNNIGMQSISSVESFIAKQPTTFSYLETFGIFCIEFLLPGSVYSHAALFSLQWNDTSFQRKLALWFPITAFSVWILTNSFSNKLCSVSFIDNHKKIFVIIITTAITTERLILAFCTNVVDWEGIACITGALEGFCLSLVSTLVKNNGSPYYKTEEQKYTTLICIARAFGFLVFPHLYYLTYSETGISFTQSLFGSLLLNVIPAYLLMFCPPMKTEINTKSLSESLFYQSRNLRNEVISDSYESQSASYEENSDEYTIPNKYVTQNGVEVMSIIEEERESMMTFSEASHYINIFKEHGFVINEANTQEAEDDSISCWVISLNLFLFLLLTISKTLLTLAFVTIIPLCLAKEKALFINLIGGAWLLHTALLTMVETHKPTKTGIFIFGLILCACGLSPDPAEETGSAFLIAFGICAVIQCEKVTEYILLEDRLYMISISKGLSAILTLGSYSLIFFLTPYKLDRAFIFFLYSIAILAVLLLWLLIIFIKYTCKRCTK